MVCVNITVGECCDGVQQGGCLTTVANEAPMSCVELAIE